MKRLCCSSSLGLKHAPVASHNTNRLNFLLQQTVQQQRQYCQYSWSNKLRRAMHTFSSMDNYQFLEQCQRHAAVESSDDNAAKTAIPIQAVTKDQFKGWLEQQSATSQNWLRANQVKYECGKVHLLPGSEGSIQSVVIFISNAESDVYDYAPLPALLPGGLYSFDRLAQDKVDTAALGWLLGSYKYKRYLTKTPSNTPENPENPEPQLTWPPTIPPTRRDTLRSIASSIFLGQDLINTPPEDLPPAILVQTGATLVQNFGGTARIVSGDELLSEGYPAIHTVGRASAMTPALLDARWAPGGGGGEGLPRVTLVGKGVVFDTGGLNIKPSSGMKLMKKDMGGAAFVLSLAYMIMHHNLPINLRFLVPSVENSISSNAFRPSDVLRTRAGISVENGNTDAEGRLIMCDCLADAATESPDLLIDAATLTGAARVGLGTRIPVVFCTEKSTYEGMEAESERLADPLWRLPLFEPYQKMIKSSVADTNSCGDDGRGGAITAALFLKLFVEDVKDWVHFDFNGYRQGPFTGPGVPEGGDVGPVRAVFEYLIKRYGGSKE